VSLGGHFARHSSSCRHANLAGKPGVRLAGDQLHFSKRGYFSAREGKKIMQFLSDR
jgi:hypothetical protein